MATDGRKASISTSHLRVDALEDQAEEDLSPGEDPDLFEDEALE